MIKAGFRGEDEREGLRITLARDGCGEPRAARGFVARICRSSPDLLNKIGNGRFQRGV
jgi:hypothetical protein